MFQCDVHEEVPMGIVCMVSRENMTKGTHGETILGGVHAKRVVANQRSMHLV
jgi:hypothetical protein